MIKYTYYVASINGVEIQKDELLNNQLTYEELSKFELKYYSNFPDADIEDVRSTKVLKYKKLSHLIDDFIYFNAGTGFNEEELLFNLTENNIVIRKELKTLKYEVIDDEHIKNCFYQITNSLNLEGDVHEIPQENLVVLNSVYKTIYELIKPSSNYGSIYFFDGVVWSCVIEENRLKYSVNNTLGYTFEDDILNRFYNSEMFLLYVNSGRKYSEEDDYIDLYGFQALCSEDNEFSFKNIVVNAMINLFNDNNFNIAPNLVFCDMKGDRTMGLDLIN